MKLSSFLLSLFIAHSVNAASISVNNKSVTPTDLHIRSSAGGLNFGSGVFAFYELASAPTNALAAQQLGVSGRLGNEYLVNSSEIDPSGAFTILDINLGSLQATDANISTTDFYFIIGNGSSLTSSTELAVLQIGNTASEQLGTGEAVYNYSLSASDVRIGTVGTGTADYTALDPGNPALENFAIQTLNLAVVPEPSSTLLILLGGIALIRRRR